MCARGHLNKVRSSRAAHISQIWRTFRSLLACSACANQMRCRRRVSSTALCYVRYCALIVAMVDVLMRVRRYRTTAIAHTRIANTIGQTTLRGTIVKTRCLSRVMQTSCLHLPSSITHYTTDVFGLIDDNTTQNKLKPTCTRNCCRSRSHQAVRVNGHFSCDHQHAQRPCIMQVINLPVG